MLTIPVSTFRELVAGGLLPQGVKIGKHRRWARERLNASLADLLSKPDDGGVSAALRGIADGQKAKGGRHAA